MNDPDSATKACANASPTGPAPRIAIRDMSWNCGGWESEGGDVMELKADDEDDDGGDCAAGGVDVGGDVADIDVVAGVDADKGVDDDVDEGRCEEFSRAVRGWTPACCSSSALPAMIASCVSSPCSSAPYSLSIVSETILMQNSSSLRLYM